MYKKITDERLVLKNLNNLRIAFIVQTLGIIGILGYDFVTKGIDGMTSNPLWIVFVMTVIVLAYLSMSISVDYETSEKSPSRSLLISIVVVTIISMIIGILVTLTEGFGVIDGLMIGGILFICSLIPVLYIFYLRKKQQS